jgi:Rad3-related DNA helicase
VTTVDDEFKDNWIVFIECNGLEAVATSYGVLHLKPIDVAPLIHGNLLSVIPNIIFMSATLKIGDSFAFMRKELGLGRGELRGVYRRDPLRL